MKRSLHGYLSISISKNNLPILEKLYDWMKANGKEGTNEIFDVHESLRTLRGYGALVYKEGDCVRLHTRYNKKLNGKVAFVTGRRYGSVYTVQLPNGKLDYDMTPRDMEPVEPEPKHVTAWITKRLSK